jgi:hypothetical protein
VGVQGEEPCDGPLTGCFIPCVFWVSMLVCCLPAMFQVAVFRVPAHEQRGGTVELASAVCRLYPPPWGPPALRNGGARHRFDDVVSPVTGVVLTAPKHYVHHKLIHTVLRYRATATANPMKAMEAKRPSTDASYTKY